MEEGQALTAQRLLRILAAVLEHDQATRSSAEALLRGWEADAVPGGPH
jgi:hypothetical protein